MPSEDASLYRLMSWLSPSYPVGAYTYSHGLEYAVERGFVCNAETARLWIEDLVARGGGFSDAAFLAAAHRAAAAGDDEGVRQVAELAAVFVPTRELALESHAQGRAFRDVTMKAWPCAALDRLVRDWSGPLAYPVVVGVAAAGHGMALPPVLIAYLHAFSSNLVSAVVRLVPLGQTEGQKITARLEATISAVASAAAACRLDELGTAVPRADLCSMNHETQYTRLFRS
ncbi:MAG: urease accessory protein UreF [Hyphomicrobiales bacterium]|nr:urease accessory protein UreF [Hyphomicrobiales bacterium]